MTVIRMARNVKALLARADRLLVVAAKARLAKKHFPAVLGARLGSLAIDVAADLSPGDFGATGATLTQGAKGTPKKLIVSALPDKASRHNSDARAEAVRRCVAASGIAGKGRGAILIVLEDKAHALAAANAAHRALPLFSLKSGAKGRTRERSEVELLLVDAAGNPVALDRGALAVCGATREMARLVDSPPTDLNPEAFAREARSFLRGLRGVTIQEVRGNALLARKLGGIHAVGRCAMKPPRLILVKYGGGARRGRASRHVALVGKGITYDTGGLSLKTASTMAGMKGDMGGAAAVLGAFRALVAGGCRHRLSLLLCVAENAIGPQAYKVDDVLRLHSGKTVEINNTDAEGRLLLADGVSYATRVLGADVVFDAATLTGAQLVATGLLHAAVVCNDDALEQTVLAAGKASGDLVHPLPFCPEFYHHEFRSSVADMTNSVKDRANAGPSCAAAFIHWHVDDQPMKWCHVDLAGPAMPADRATGFGVALLYRAVMDL